MVPDLADYFGYGRSKKPIHRSDVTVCPCTDCKRARGVGDGLKAQTEAVRFILFLKWLRWKFSKERNKRVGKRQIDEG